MFNYIIKKATSILLRFEFEQANKKLLNSIFDFNADYLAAKRNVRLAAKLYAQSLKELNYIK